MSLSKLREFHGSFKSVCDNFSIDFTEFEQIFGANESVFVIWDIDTNGLIDSLELFSGLILFSETKFEDKARFLFDIFDFNELGSLATIDIEFMISSCLNSTFKILSKNKEADLDEIHEIVEKGFSKDQRIDITEFIKWAKNSEECLTLIELLSGAELEKKKGK